MGSILLENQLAVCTIINEQQATFPPSVTTNMEYEAIDLLLLKSIKFADKGCRKICLQS
jgi:hypothetical protein